MRWVNHIAQSAAVAAVFNPIALPAAVLGSTAPDWLEWFGRWRGRRIEHRRVTHYLVFWVMLAVFGHFVWDWRGYIFWFAIGGTIHWIQDALTITGAPVGWWSRRRTTLLGGRFRTGSSGEYMVTCFVVMVCAVVVWQTRTPDGDYLPFFPDWKSRSESGLVDAKEWKDKRFDWF
jgi:inner membrane protein